MTAGACARFEKRDRVRRERMVKGADRWDWAQTLSADAWDRAWNHRAVVGAGSKASGRTLGNGHRRIGPGTNSRRGLLARTGLQARTQGPGAAEGDSGSAIAIETCVWARTGATSGAGLNGPMLERRRAHAAIGAGV
jgi:hypothetical protein